MRVLGLETSCDETGVALYDSERGLLADALFSQIDLHRVYGGVVPELASRDHVKRMLPLIRQVLDESGCTPADIDAIAYTAGPGLVGALLVGASCAQAMAFAWGVPAVGVHHMEGHLLAPMLEEQPPRFPFVALLVSGGHTQLVRVDGIGRYQLLGESVDDAAGEAFDKTAKLIGLGYPGGPEIARLAEFGTPGRFVFPRPMTDRPGLDFSFSGLKTFTLNTWQRCVEAGDDSEQTRCDIALAFQTAVVETLLIKCRDDQAGQHGHRQQRSGLLPGQQRQGQRGGHQRGERAGARQLEGQQPGRCGQQYGRRIEAEEHARGGGDTLAAAEVEVQRIQVADHCGDADPGLLHHAEPQPAGDQHRQQAFADVAEQGQDGEFLPGDAQHVGRAGVAGTAGARVLGAEPAAEQDGEGEGTEQVGEDRQ